MMKTRPSLPPLRALSSNDGKAMLDARARAQLGMSGAVFVQRWKAGHFRRCSNSAAQRLAMLIPFSQ
jgi:hypothetical protein